MSILREKLVFFLVLILFAACSESKHNTSQDYTGLNKNNNVIKSDRFKYGNNGFFKDKPVYIKDEVLVLFRENVSISTDAKSRFTVSSPKGDASLQSLLKRLQVKDISNVLSQKFFTKNNKRSISTTGSDQLSSRLAHLKKIKISTDPSMAAALLKNHPDVLFAEPNYVATSTMVPNDAYYHTSNSWQQGFEDLWGLNGAFGINPEQAWDSTLGEGVIVAVIDTGVDYTHEELNANIWQNSAEIPGNNIDDDNNGYVDDTMGWSFAEGNNNPMDRFGHGTHVAGTIAATGNNIQGIIGVAPGAKIMIVKGLDDGGSGSYSDLINAIIYAADMGAHVINNSWGGLGKSQAMLDAIAYAIAKGSVVVASAGNSSAEAKYYFPTGAEGVISVGAIAADGSKAEFSNFGDDIDVVAPGVGILSLLARDSLFSFYLPNVLEGKYIPLDGTSMSAPHVAGLAALIKSIHPEYTPDHVRHLLQRSSTAHGSGSWNRQFGFGLINAANAVAMQNQPRIKAILTTPSPFETGSKHNFGKNSFIVEGSASGNDFSYYTLSYRKFNQGKIDGYFTAFKYGFSQVEKGQLGSLSANSLQAGRYVIKLAVYGKNGIVAEDYKEFVKDTTLKNGWPQQTAAPDLWATYNQVTVTFADLDNDGVKEVVTASNDKIYAWDANGNLKPNFPIQLPRMAGSPLTIADIDGDGDLEIILSIKIDQIVTSYDDAKSIYAYHHDGTLAQGFPACIMNRQDIIPNTFLYVDSISPVVIADLDGDGTVELIALAHGSNAGTWEAINTVGVLDANGSLKPGWPKKLKNNRAFSERSLTVADFDNDGYKDILATGTFYFDNGTEYFVEYTLNILSHEGGKKHERVITVESHGWEPNNLNIVADMDNDGHKEIFLLTTSASLDTDIFKSPMYLLDHELNDVAGWPKELYVKAPYCFNDVDNDGDLEIVLANNGGMDGDTGFSAFKKDGTMVNGSPVLFNPAMPTRYAMWGFSPTMTQASVNQAPEGAFFSSFIIGGQMEYGMDLSNLTAFDKQGNILTNWPKKIDMYSSTPTVGDLENDGILEIGVQSIMGMVYIFQEDARSVGGFKSKWYALGGNNRRTQVYNDIECKEYTSTNLEHVNKGRADVYYEWYVAYAKAKGSGNKLGLLGTVFYSPTTTVRETRPGYYELGKCQQ